MIAVADAAEDFMEEADGGFGDFTPASEAARDKTPDVAAGLSDASPRDQLCGEEERGGALAVGSKGET